MWHLFGRILGILFQLFKIYFLDIELSVLTFSWGLESFVFFDFTFHQPMGHFHTFGCECESNQLVTINTNLYKMTKNSSKISIKRWSNWESYKIKYWNYVPLRINKTRYFIIQNLNVQFKWITIIIGTQPK